MKSKNPAKSRLQKPGPQAPTIRDRELALFAKAIAHPARVAILRGLLERGGCVCGEIVNTLPLSQATVSQHLKVMKEAGLLSGEVDGPRVCYCPEPRTIARLKFLVGELHVKEEDMKNEGDVRESVREKYGSLAAAGGGCCGDGTGSGCGSGADVLTRIGYSDEQRAAVPEGANLGLGCGNPLGYADVKPGETVLDLGSGAGIDAFLASVQTGPAGHVIGVDMTPAMIDRARANAQKGNYSNVEFRLGEIEHLPLADSTVDVIISNCVVNLSPDKPQVFRDAHRALKPGGRLLISDLVWLREVSSETRKKAESAVGCVAGASLLGDYLRLMQDAGFKDVEVLAQNNYASPQVEGSADIGSVKVRARKA